MVKLKISHCMLNVSDMERSVEFYVNKLGFKLTMPPREAPDPRDPKINIKIAMLADEDGGAVELGCPAYQHLSLAVDDVEKAIEEFKSKGIEIAREPFQMPEGRMSPIWFKDPDGIYIEIIQRR